MIGLFDSSNGGITVLRSLCERFPGEPFVYLGDHANAPYGNRDASDVLRLTQAGVSNLFDLGCKLVLLACNTASAVACRRIQQKWLPDAGYAGCNVLGIVAPTVELATQVPWAVTTPQYPQKFNTETIAVFATRRTVSSNVYPEEIRKRCPRVRVVQQACPSLAGAIERGAGAGELEGIVEENVAALLDGLDGHVPESVILGCTHYPVLANCFRAALAPATRVLAQPRAVADSLEDYLSRHPHYCAAMNVDPCPPRLLTTGDCRDATKPLAVFWPDAPPYNHL